jgi:HEAT repeat protein
MDIKEIESYLESSDPQKRLKALTELRRNDYTPEIAVPLILRRKEDKEFIIRSFVAMALGRKQTPEAYLILLEMAKFDQDYNVRAEASNSLSFYGQISIAHLLELFIQDTNWLVRISILAALFELNSPDDTLKACLYALESQEITVKEMAIDGLGLLANTIKNDPALRELLKLVDHGDWVIRAKVASSLKQFSQLEAKEALALLKRDLDHRVVASALETSVINIEGRD